MVCDKIAYNSYKDAQEAAAKNPINKKNGFKTYKCKECGKFHLASIKNKSLKPIIKGDIKNTFNHPSDRYVKEAVKNTIPNNKPYHLYRQKLATFKLGEILSWPKK